MKDFLIQLFIIIPFVLNGISLAAGVLLYIWQLLQRRFWNGKHK